MTTQSFGFRKGIIFSGMPSLTRGKIYITICQHLYHHSCKLSLYYFSSPVYKLCKSKGFIILYMIVCSVFRRITNK